MIGLETDFGNFSGYVLIARPSEDISGSQNIFIKRYFRSIALLIFEKMC